MPAHQNKMLLDYKVDGTNVATTIELLAQEHWPAVDALVKIHNRLAPTQFYQLLHFCDAKGYHGEILSEFVFEVFNGEAAKFCDFMVNQAPCVICKQVWRAELVAKEMNAVINSGRYFAQKFDPFRSPHFSVEQQLKYYAETTAFRNKSAISLQPLPGIEQYCQILDDIMPMATEEELDSRIVREVTYVDAEALNELQRPQAKKRILPVR